jgi:hypothetical protein
MNAKDKVRAMLRKEASGSRLEAVRAMLRKEARLETKGTNTLKDLLTKAVQSLPVNKRAAKQAAIRAKHLKPASVVDDLKAITPPPAGPGLMRRMGGGMLDAAKKTPGAAKKAPGAIKNALGTRAGKAAAYGIPAAAGAAMIASPDPDSVEGVAAPDKHERALYNVRRAKRKAKSPGTPAAAPKAAPTGTDGLSDEAMAGAGGAMVGGAIGYNAADSLGIDKMTGMLGGAGMTALAAAVVAHRMKA